MEKLGRQLTFEAAAGYTAREEMFDGRKHLVVPIVALVEGVVQAMNAEYPELVTAEEYAKAPAGWNGRPVFLGHPVVNGEPVSGNSPALLESQKIGTVFNTAIRKGKLAMEAWIDVARAEEVAPELLERIAKGETIEISVGAFVEREESEGEYNGKQYYAIWREIVPDHLALLPASSRGACSVKMGCGVRAAEEKQMKSKFSAFVGRVVGAFRVEQSAGEMSGNDLMRKLYEALRGLEPNLNYIDTYRPVNNPTSVIYSCYEGNGVYCFYERSFTLSADGTVEVNAAQRTEVEPVLDYKPVAASDPTNEPAAAADPTKDKEIAPAAAGEPTKPVAGSTCACGGHGNQPATALEADMTREEMLATLSEGANDVQKAAIAVLKGETPAVAVPAAAAVVETPAPAASEAKEVTLEDLLSKASPDVRAAHTNAVRAAADRRATSIKALKDTKRCTISDEKLAAMSQDELDQLVSLAAIPAAKSQPVDYIGQAPRAAAAGDEGSVPAAPDLIAALSEKK